MSEQISFDPVRALVEKLRKNSGLPPLDGGGEDERAEKCPVCGGTGWEWLGYDKQLYSWVTACKCSAVENARRRIASSGLADLLASCTFDGFMTREPFQAFMARKAAAYEGKVVAGERPWFFVGGQPGCGKTHICTAICGKLLENRVDVSYFQWAEDARRLKALTNDRDFDAAILPFVGASVLYIDDLFKAAPGSKPTDADVSLAFRILNARYNQNKPTIISSEKTSSELLEFDQGTFSRMMQRADEFVLNIGPDVEKNFRLHEKK